jgi:hypothetical protein
MGLICHRFAGMLPPALPVGLQIVIVLVTVIVIITTLSGVRYIEIN